MFSFFRKNFNKLVAKGDRLYERRELGYARGEYAEALSAFREGDDPAEKARVEARLAEIGRELAGRQIAEARRSAAAGEAHAARVALEAAVDLARDVDPALVAEAEALLAELDAGDLEGVAGEAEEPEVPADPDMELELLIQTQDEARQEAYRALGPHFRDGVLALHDGDGEAAEAAFARVEGDSPWLAYERGRAAMLRDRAADAVPLLRAAADALGDEASPALAQLTLAAVAAEDADTAEAAAARFTALVGEDDPDATVLRIQAARARKRWDVALQHARRHLKRHPADLATWRTAGMLHEEAGQPEQAIAAYEQVMSLRWQLDPVRRVVNLDAYSASRLARLLVDRGERLDRAFQLINALDLLTPPTEKWSIAVLRADALRADGRAEEAATLLDAVLADPATPAEARPHVTEARAKLP